MKQRAITSEIRGKAVDADPDSLAELGHAQAFSALRGSAAFAMPPTGVMRADEAIVDGRVGARRSQATPVSHLANTPTTTISTNTAAVPYEHELEINDNRG